MARKGRHMCQPTDQDTNQKASAQHMSTKAKTAVPRKQNRCMRPGPLQRNPYLNFLRKYRQKCCGLSAVETVRRGAQAWKSLSKEEKARYIVEAFYTRKRRKSLTRFNLRGRRQARKSKLPVRSKKSRRPRQTNRLTCQ